MKRKENLRIFEIDKKIFKPFTLIPIIQINYWKKIANKATNTMIQILLKFFILAILLISSESTSFALSNVAYCNQRQLHLNGDGDPLASYNYTCK